MDSAIYGLPAAELGPGAVSPEPASDSSTRSKTMRFSWMYLGSGNVGEGSQQVVVQRSVVEVVGDEEIPPVGLRLEVHVHRFLAVRAGRP